MRPVRRGGRPLKPLCVDIPGLDRDAHQPGLYHRDGARVTLWASGCVWYIVTMQAPWDRRRSKGSSGREHQRAERIRQMFACILAAADGLGCELARKVV